MWICTCQMLQLQANLPVIQTQNDWTCLTKMFVLMTGVLGPSSRYADTSK